MLRQIISNGLPAGVQNSIIALANVVVQSNINSFGKMAMAGCGSYSKSGGLRFSPRYLFCPFHDHLHQPEYRGEEI